MRTIVRAACSALLALGALAPAAGAQSLLDRSPNLNGAWGGSTGQLYFNFMLFNFFVQLLIIFF